MSKDRHEFANDLFYFLAKETVEGVTTHKTSNPDWSMNVQDNFLQFINNMSEEVINVLQQTLSEYDQ
jgi:hypothetical protein